MIIAKRQYTMDKIGRILQSFFTLSIYIILSHVGTLVCTFFSRVSTIDFVVSNILDVFDNFSCIYLYSLYVVSTSNKDL